MSLKLLLLSHGPRKFGTSDFPSDAGAAGAAIAVNSPTTNIPAPLIQAPLIISQSSSRKGLARKLPLVPGGIYPNLRRQVDAGRRRP
jgi:hypothetical protein